MAECGGRSVIAHPASGFADRDKLAGQCRSTTQGQIGLFREIRSKTPGVAHLT